MTVGRASTRYHDTEFQRPGIKLMPAEIYTTGEDLVLTTVLGSCVAACLFDPIARVGGMNHFMLPDTPVDPGQDPSWTLRYGLPAMERLVDEVLALGARRERLEAKVFGGAAVLPGMTRVNVGARNAAFVRQHLAASGIRQVAEDLEGVDPRRVSFLPTVGTVRMRRLPRSEDFMGAAIRTLGA